MQREKERERERVSECERICILHECMRLADQHICELIQSHPQMHTSHAVSNRHGQFKMVAWHLYDVQYTRLQRFTLSFANLLTCIYNRRSTHTYAYLCVRNLCWVVWYLKRVMDSRLFQGTHSCLKRCKTFERSASYFELFWFIFQKYCFCTV